MAGCLKKPHKPPPKPRDRRGVMNIRDSTDGANYVPAVCAVWDAYQQAVDQEQRIRILEGGRK